MSFPKLLISRSCGNILLASESGSASYMSGMIVKLGERNNVHLIGDYSSCWLKSDFVPYDRVVVLHIPNTESSTLVSEEEPIQVSEEGDFCTTCEHLTPCTDFTDEELLILCPLVNSD